MTAPYRKVNYAKIIQKYALITSLAFLAPIIVTVIGVVVMSTHNDRLNLLQLFLFPVCVRRRYNKRVLQWKEQEGEFNMTSFFYDSSPLLFATIPQEHYFPLADSCSLKGDPKEGCMYSSSSYFVMNLTHVSGSFTIPIFNDLEDLVVNDTVSATRVIKYSKKSLNCWDGDSCSRMCSEHKGEWDYAKNECVITHYLSKVCYRVSFVNDSFVLDTSS